MLMLLVLVPLITLSGSFTPRESMPAIVQYSARQGVEDDHMNIICMGGRTVGPAVAWDLVETFLAAGFSGAARHLRRLGKVASLETQLACDRQGVGTAFHEPC